MSEQYTELFCKLVQLAGKLGVKDIKNFPGCWEHQLNDDWWFAMNGKPDEIECSKGDKVPSYNTIFYDGDMPVGLCSPFGGGFLSKYGIPGDTENELISIINEILDQEADEEARVAQ